MRVILKAIRKKPQYLLFFITALLYMCWLYNIGSMILVSGDAAVCWRSITTWFSPERYGGYTLYKGFSSIYPYVWFYHLAKALRLNEFFFCMLYFALLFAFITTIGVPAVVERLTGFQPRLYQRVLLPIFFFIIWKPTYALSELMVDLPSCAFFVAAVLAVLTIPQTYGKKRKVIVLVTGLLTGLCANISGQYSVSSICLVLMSVWLILSDKNNKLDRKMSRPNQLAQTILLLAGFAALKIVNSLFMTKAVAPLVADGAFVPTGSWLLKKGTMWFLDKNRGSPGVMLMNPRGYAILEDMYGSKELVEEALDRAAGGMGWTIPEYFRMILKYPVDAVVQGLDKFFLSFSIDMGRFSAFFLVLGYSLVFVAVWNAIRNVHKWRDILNPNIFLAAAVLCAILPLIVFTVELRCAIGAQSIVFGLALLCDSFPNALNNLAYIVSRGRLGTKKVSAPLNLYIVWLVFILLCMMHIGTLYAQSDIGTEMLFELW